jgi:hypothetical protein
MDRVEKTLLYSTLSSNVGTMSVQAFYNAFNLVSCDYKEFSFNEMTDIFYLEGMEKWHSVLDACKQDDRICLIRLVGFNPPRPNESDSRKTNAFLKTKTMFHNCFLKPDHEHIDAAMSHFPTMGIFMMLTTKQRMKQINQGTNEGSIFHANGANKVRL